jgi:hypothetical protein
MESKIGRHPEIAHLTSKFAADNVHEFTQYYLVAGQLDSVETR